MDDRLIGHHLTEWPLGTSFISSCRVVKAVKWATSIDPRIANEKPKPAPHKPSWFCMQAAAQARARKNAEVDMISQANKYEGGGHHME